MESIDLFKLPPKVFVSYSHTDRDFVEKLAYDLAKSRILVWWDEWEIKVGDSLMQKIESGILNSSYLAIVLTPSSVASAWVKEEFSAAFIRQLAERRTFVLPILLSNCDIPVFLQDKKYADFRKDYDFGMTNLLRAISSPDVGVQGREEIKDNFNDYAIDWFRKDTLYGFKVELTSHSTKLPYSVKATIIANANDRLSARLDQYIAAGFSWVIPSMLMIQIGDAISVKPPILYIKGDEITEENFEVADPKHGTSTDIKIEARRLGTDPGDDILYEWGSIFAYIMDKHVERVRNVISQEEMTKWKHWFTENPIKPL